MARAFLREKGRYVGLLDATERTVLHGLMEQTRVLLSPETEATGDTFDDLVASMGFSLGADDAAGDAGAEGRSAHRADRDPALDRLLPTAHRGDNEVAAEFRRLTEEGLRQRKSRNLDIALERLSASTGDRVELDEAQAPAFLMALTDVRLLLGERMGLRTEEDADALYSAVQDLEDDDPLGYAVAWYDFLTWLQETLAHAVMGTDLGEVTSLDDPAEEHEPDDDDQEGPFRPGAL